jgi:CubicO group peptidase (beta-lactamase class C family)
VDRARLEAALERAFAGGPEGATGLTHALVAIRRGALALERYGAEGGRDVRLPSWSMAKSMLHALVGIAVRDGLLDVAKPAGVPAWEAAGDPRGAITLDQLLRMSSGLAFREEYVDAEKSDVIEMLFGAGKDDVAGFAESFPLAHAPDRVFSYSSGTSNIVSAILRRRLGGGDALRAYLHGELFDRLGMRSADPRFDAAGTWIGSSFAFATALDFARFGLLYLRDGVWDGERVLPEGWVDYARTPTRTSPEAEYGAHWWLAQDGSGIFNASGYRGQYIVVDPSRDLVVVRLGASEPEQRGAVYLFLREVVQSFPPVA